MDKKLFFQAVFKFLMGVVLVCVLVFLPAGTLSFFNGWLFVGLLFVPMFVAGLVMMVKNPELLKSRLDAKEKQGDQSVIIKLSGLMFILAFVVAGLDFRFSLLPLPKWVAYVASAVFLFAYVLYAEVLRENTYLSRTIEVQENQKVIDTGMYSIVRHPMYSVTVLLFLSMPFILGSLYSFFVMLLYPVLIGFRIKGEEKFLEQNLDGYKEYKEKVRYRLIPFVW